METIRCPHVVKANKEHVCNFCNVKIVKGETYMSSTHKLDADIYDWKSHQHCADIAKRLKMYEDADEGLTREAFQEIIACKHQDLMFEILPFDAVRTGRFSDIIQQLKYVNFKDMLQYVMRHYKKIDDISIKCIKI